VFDDRGSSSAGTAVGIFAGMAGAYWLGMAFAWMFIVFAASAIGAVVLAAVLVVVCTKSVIQILRAFKEVPNMLLILGISMFIGALACMGTSVIMDLGPAELLAKPLAEDWDIDGYDPNFLKVLGLGALYFCVGLALLIGMLLCFTFGIPMLLYYAGEAAEMMSDFDLVDNIYQMAKPFAAYGAALAFFGSVGRVVAINQGYVDPPGLLEIMFFQQY
jgi:hypothetical protein